MSDELHFLVFLIIGKFLLDILLDPLLLNSLFLLLKSLLLLLSLLFVHLINFFFQLFVFLFGVFDFNVGLFKFIPDSLKLLLLLVNFTLSKMVVQLVYFVPSQSPSWDTTSVVDHCGELEAHVHWAVKNFVKYLLFHVEWGIRIVKLLSHLVNQVNWVPEACTDWSNGDSPPPLSYHSGLISCVNTISFPGSINLESNLSGDCESCTLQKNIDDIEDYITIHISPFDVNLFQIEEPCSELEERVKLNQELSNLERQEDFPRKKMS